MKTEKLMNELDTAYVYAVDNCDTATPEGMEQYRLMNQCIEQYRREMCNSTLKEVHAKPINQ